MLMGPHVGGGKEWNVVDQEGIKSQLNVDEISLVRTERLLFLEDLE